MNQNMKPILVNLNRLKTAYKFYESSDEVTRGKILSSMERVFEFFDEMFEGGYSFAVLYVLYGDRFFKEEPTIKFDTMEDYIASLS